MTRKRTDAATAKAAPSQSGEAGNVPTPGRHGKVLLAPGMMNMLAISQNMRFLGEADGTGLLNALNEETKKIRDGDLSYIEAMLVGQAATLQTLFVSLLIKANSQDQLNHWEAYRRLGLKAQNQCRMTLEALDAIKNPPVVFARQANIANGPQQVNNNVPVEAPSPPANPPAGNSSIVKTELLEAGDGQRMDTRTARAASGADTQVEALGKVHRAAKRRG